MADPESVTRREVPLEEWVGAVAEARDAGVAIELARAGTASEIVTAGPDVVVVATGAREVAPPVIDGVATLGVLAALLIVLFFVDEKKPAEEEGSVVEEPFDAFAGGYPVPPMSSAFATRPATGSVPAATGEGE